MAGKGEAVMFETTQSFKVVVNDECQFSLWPADRVCPGGWREEGTRGPRETCLEHIKSAWRDMSPLSLRRALGEEV